MYPDGKRCVLYSNAQDFYDCYHHNRWFFQTYENHLTPFDLLPLKQNFFYFQSDLAGELDNQFVEIKKVGLEMVKHYLETYQIGDFFYITSKYNTHSESFIFACQKTGAYKTIILNNIDLLSKFAEYFKKHADKLIKRALNEPLMQPWREEIDFWDFHENNIINLPDKNKFMYSFRHQNFPTSRLTIAGKNLTKRELVCATYLMQGYSAREISEQLYRSKRTIEVHINHLKEKLGARSRSALITKLLDLQLI